MKLIPLALVCATLVLTGCAASGPKMAEVSSSMPALKSDQGRVFFYRKDTMLGAALTPNVMMDGKAVGVSRRGSFFYVDAATGSHEAATTTEATNKVSFVLAPGESKYVRTDPSMGVLMWRITPTLVGADEAKAEMAALSYTGGAQAK